MKQRRISKSLQLCSNTRGSGPVILFSRQLERAQQPPHLLLVLLLLLAVPSEWTNFKALPTRMEKAFSCFQAALKKGGVMNCHPSDFVLLQSHWHVRACIGDV